MTIILWIGVGLCAAAVVLGLVRVLTAKDNGTRAIVGDLVYFCAVAVIAIMAVFADMTIALDVIFLASLLGILSTVALSRIQTRGHR
ncbi:monovalent cation/H+ antiporter complex subunit F [Brevibacterium litoralis]|uniref:monovalent cation/H+ antiporter complex subunit F n=1 Tax=Brevibacterium litoralis TaxID=3138935 RepID=UPI0032EB2ADC